MNTVSTIGPDQLNQLVERAKQGDKAAFQSLVAKMTSPVCAIALAITKNIQDSKDVSQLVFIKMWQQLGELKNNDSLLPWLRQTTRYTALNYIRDNKSTAKFDSDDATLEHLLQQVCEQPHSDQQLIKQQQNQLIRHLIDQLPSESREIVILYYREEQNSHAVAQLLDISDATVRKRLQRVRAILKQQLLDKYGKLIYTTAPIGLYSTFALTAMASSPAAATGIGYGAASASHTSWLGKLIMSLGGAGLGAILAVFANSMAIKQTLKHVDNSQDQRVLIKLKRVGNIWIVLCCALLWLSYEYSHGWLLPVITYTLFLVGLIYIIRNTNRISFANLTRQAKLDAKLERKLRRAKIGNIVGWIVGVGGGSAGLIYGLYVSGRFAQLF